MEEQRRKRQYLEEQYYEEKNKIHRQQEVLSNQLVNFRRETGQLVDKVNYLTKMINGTNSNFTMQWNKVII